MYMKRIVLIFILISIFCKTFGQGPLEFIITFDSSTNINITLGDTAHFNFSNWIYIDNIKYPNNKWQIGRPNKTVFSSAYSLPNAIVTDTIFPCSPNDTSVFILKIPKNPWLGLISLSFHYKLNVDSGDIAQMEWSGDTGLHWTNILTDSNGLFSGTPSLITTSTSWDSMRLYPYYPPWESFAPYVDTYYIRFTYIADSSTLPRDGWMIDNFYFSYDGESVPYITSMENRVSIHPSPASTNLNISSSKPITQITITNLLGEVVFTKYYNKEEVQVDVSGLPNGLYFIKINGTEVRKFIKQ